MMQRENKTDVFTHTYTHTHLSSIFARDYKCCLSYCPFRQAFIVRMVYPNRLFCEGGGGGAFKQILSKPIFFLYFGGLMGSDQEVMILLLVF